MSNEYEELTELPDTYDYSDVHLKDNVFLGYEEEKVSLNLLIQNSIGNGESGTVLVYGGPGSGKTKFVDTCLNESELAKNCRILKLNGLIHGNDVSTIRHIGKFLGIDYPDLPRIMDSFKKACQNKCVANLIIVLDKFDEFCDKNQFLLYNFFDLIQYIEFIFVIGITTRYDCIELLEKRVKSRMNHKIITLNAPFSNLGDYLKFAKKLLDKDVPFTKNFQQSLEIQYSKSFSIAQLKCCLLENLRCPIENIQNKNPLKIYLDGKDETISIICNYLTTLEICVLLIAAKLEYVKEIQLFNINYLLAFAKEIPTQIISNQRLIFMAVGTLIDYGLLRIVEKKTMKSKKLYLTEWTPLNLNVSKFQITDALKKCKNRLPTGVDQIFSIKE